MCKLQKNITKYSIQSSWSPKAIYIYLSGLHLYLSVVGCSIFFHWYQSQGFKVREVKVSLGFHVAGCFEAWCLLASNHILLFICASYSFHSFGLVCVCYSLQQLIVSNMCVLYPGNFIDIIVDHFFNKVNYICELHHLLLIVNL